MASSTEVAELKLVSSIRYKFASASSDEKKLSQALQLQLPSLLEKAGSQHKPVRDAVFQAFISVNNFVKPAGVKIPVAALIEQYKKTTSSMVKQLDLSLIRQGVLRMDPMKRSELLPVALRGISKEASSASAAGFFNIFLRLLIEAKIPGRGTADDLKFRETVGLAESSDAKYVANWLGKLLLLRQDLALAADDELQDRLVVAPSGVTKEDILFLRNNNPQSWNPSVANNLSLPECKKKVVSFLASGAFIDDERYLPAICASGSADSRISLVADDMLKRSSVDLEQAVTVESLFAAHSTLPAAHRIQILKLLSKSVLACTLKQRVTDAVKLDFELTTGDQACVVGLESLRLHKALLAFITWVSRNNFDSKTRDTEMGPVLVVMLKDYILRQGWPIPNARANLSQQQDEQRLRANAYEIIGTLARGSSLENRTKDSLLKWLFDSLVSDPSPEIVVHIESALSSMMSLFKSEDAAQHRDLEILLMDYMTLPEKDGIRTARHVATRFANNCLPYHNVKARWIGILALAGGSSERRDVLEEGQRSLDPWWAVKLHPDETFRLPDWKELACFFFDSTPRPVGEDEMVVDQTSKYVLYPNNRIRAFPTAIRFTKQMLLLSALGDSQIEMDWESRLENRLQNELSARHQIREFLKEQADPESILLILNAAFDGLRDHPEIGAEECLDCITDVLSFAPLPTLSDRIAPRAEELLSLTNSNNQKARQLVSKAFGILAPCDQRASTYIVHLRQFIESCDEPSAAMSAQFQCSLSSLATYHAALANHGRISGDQKARDVQFVLATCVTSLSRNDTAVQDAALDSLASMWTAGIGFPQQAAERQSIIDSLVVFSQKSNEKAIHALGRLALAIPDDDQSSLTTILEKLFGLLELKRTEVHFVIGEAITAAIGRWDSDSVKLSVNIQTDRGQQNLALFKKRPDRISATLDKVINDSKATRPALIKASGIWLFCIVQFCSGLVEVQSRLRECQVAFMRLLTARDELVQETASRGLALVYEKGDESLKGDLVKDLVASFTGTKTQLKVDEDTELFDAGALPTGEGKSVTSYKDIINLANEVGDQRLIYKFMALATNAATWTTRSAFGRFGLSSILSEAEMDPKIYPKLYRYRFDPNPNVRRSMEDIWKAVVKDQTATIDQHFDAIMTDLLKSILDGREWRVREASCAAIADLIYGQPFAKYDKYYIDVWRVTLKVLDDRKGSVRGAALKLCIALSKTVVSQLQDNNSTSSAQAMVAQVLPFLLSDKGIENSVEEVKFMAINTVLDVVKNGGDALKPFLPTIIVHFLGLLSTIEPSVVSYHYQRVGVEDREELDKLRSSAATGSPLFECISNCLRFIDEQVMADLAPQLVSTMKSALGMQTKIGCSEVLSTLAMRHSILLPPFNAIFVKALQVQIFDRNNEVSKAYAKSAAYLLRSSSAKIRESYTRRLVETYFKPVDDDTPRQKVADAVFAISKVSPDAFSDLESRLLPFSYYAKHDTDEYVSEVLEAVWSQNAGGSNTIKRYVDEITTFVSEGLNVSKWPLQHAAAFAIASMITALSSGINEQEQFSESNIHRIWPVLDRALALKTFKGKEKLVTAFPTFISHSKQLWQSDTAISAQTKKIAIREAKRNNDEYRPFALEALAGFAAAREDVDMYSEVAGIVSDHLNPDGDKHKLSDSERKAVEAALKALLIAYNRPRLHASPSEVLSDIATGIENAKEAVSLSRDTFFTQTAKLMQQAAEQGTPSSTDQGTLAMRWFRLLLRDEGDVVLESQRNSRAKALGAFASAWRRGIFGPVSTQGALNEEMGDKVKQVFEAERSLDVQKMLETKVLSVLTS